MAYVAMNSSSKFMRFYERFLSGVCRHEQRSDQMLGRLQFLSGVCRHEPRSDQMLGRLQFLSGVCRHEL